MSELKVRHELAPDLLTGGNREWTRINANNEDGLASIGVHWRLII